ncbi:unnamed protein product [Schistosoma turkestanicum]|nr:unnamed protein product [Schistosoma turkestanicum]
MSLNNESNNNLLSSLSNATKKLTGINSSLFNNYEEFIKSRDFYPSITWTNNANNHEMGYSQSDLYTNELTEESNPVAKTNPFHSMKAINCDKELLPNNNTIGNALDYSINSLISDQKNSALSMIKSSSVTHSNYAQNSCEYLNKNNLINNFLSTCSIEQTLNSMNILKNPKINGGCVLKRKYSKNHSNLSEKHSKYMKVDHDHSHPLDPLNTNADFEKYNHDVMDTVKSNKTVRSNDQQILLNHNSNEVNVSNNDDGNNNDTKVTSISTGAYKYLTWREKDRRRRFREEWKHLWLVIPYGRYEVMCLVCHKVMTQRKLDTIKRHNVRRHIELQGMSHSERQILFDKLLKQQNIQNETSSTSTSTILSSKPTRKSKNQCKSTSDNHLNNSFSSKDSNEMISSVPQNTNKWTTKQISENNEVTNSGIINLSSSINSSLSSRIPHKKTKRLFSKLTENVSTTNELLENATSKRSKRLSKQIRKQSHYPSSSIPENLNDNCNLSVNRNPIQKSSITGWENSFGSLDHSILDNKLKITSNQQTFVSDNSLSTSVIQQSPLVSTTSDASNYSSLTFPSHYSSVLPLNYDLGKLKHFIKSLIPMYDKSFSQLSPTKLQSPVACHTVNTSNKLTTPSLCTELKSTTTTTSSDNNMLNIDLTNSMHKANQNIPFDIEKHTVINEYNKIRSDQSSAIIGDKAFSGKNYLSDNSNNNNDHMSKRKSPPDQFNLSNMDEQSKCLRSSSSPSSSFAANNSNPNLTELSPFMLASLIAPIINSSKASNPKLFNEHFSNLPEFIWNNQSNSHSNKLIVNKQTETLITPKCSTDQLQNHYLQPTQSTDFKLRTKSNSNLNKFTISSLLNTELFDQKTQSRSDSMENNHNHHHHTNSFFKVNHKQEVAKCMPNSECLS